jgi:signal transduction histidine kinase
VPAEVDRVQIERMLSNLLSNALKFTPGRRPRTRGAAQLPEAIEIEVEDTGCGIPEEHIPHIFERFYRVPAQETYANPEPGLGLGLSFVAWIAKAHGGTIRSIARPAKAPASPYRCPPPCRTGAAGGRPHRSRTGPHWDE